jgi:acetyl-CoA synthetase
MAPNRPIEYPAEVQLVPSDRIAVHHAHRGRPSSPRGGFATAVSELERASYSPSAVFASQAKAGEELCERAWKDRLSFWAEQARELWWSSDFSEIVDWSNAPFVRWFVGGTTNVAVNCIDRHIAAGNGERVAIHWVGEPGDSREITYDQLLNDVGKAANYFTDIGLRAGDRVAIAMPMIPEAIVAMLACARLGLIHLTVLPDSSAEALRSYVNDAQAKLLITSDGQYRRGAPTPLKSIVDDALAGGDTPCRSVETVIVARRTGDDVVSNWVVGRDVWWHDTVGLAREGHEAQPFDAEHPLFLLYTSNGEERPKGILHTSGGYLTQARYTFHYVFDHKEDLDVFWCDADLASIAGHTYQVYGPLSDGATSVIYEGAADFPDEHRHFRIIDDYGVTIYYVAPTLIRSFIKWGREVPDVHDLSSLRLLAVIGEAINQATWQWYRDVIGGNRCLIADTWWQIETGAIMIAPLPGVGEAKPGSPVSPLPGISAHIVDDGTNLVGMGERGNLVLDRPWPSMLRGIWGDDKRFVETYWSQFAERYWCFTGVGAGYDDEDAIWIAGRDNDAMNAPNHAIPDR